MCLKDLLQTTVLGSVVEFWIPLVSNSSNTSGSTVGSTLNFISPLQGSGGFYLYFGFFSTSPQDWVLDHHKVPLTTPNSYTTLQRSTDNFFLSCTVHDHLSSSTLIMQHFAFSEYSPDFLATQSSVKVNMAY